MSTYALEKTYAVSWKNGGEAGLSHRTEASLTSCEVSPGEVKLDCKGICQL